MSQVLSPVGGAFGYSTGGQIQQPDIVHPFTIVAGGAAVAAGDAVAFVALNTDTELFIEQLDVSDAAPALIAGVALEAGVAGDVILVARQGPVKVNIGAGSSVAAGESAGVGNADGALDTGLATAMAAGVFLGTEIGTTNQAWVDLRPSAYGPAAS